MKTDKFEKTIRQKLESISPDFQENDWTKMQNYMQVHTPPTFWQQYGSWLGYAAAASVSTVMAFLYVNQLSQNNNLISDVKQLQSQIEVIKSAPEVIQKTDTVYIVQKELTKDQYLRFEPQNIPATSKDQNRVTIEESGTGQQNGFTKRNDLTTEQPVIAENKTQLPSEPADQKSVKENSVNAGSKDAVAQSTNTETLNGNTDNKFVAGKTVKNNGSNVGNADHFEGTENSAIAIESNSNVPPAFSFNKTLGGDFDNLSEIQGIQLSNSSRQMNYALVSHLSPRQVKKVLFAALPAVDDKKIEKTSKAENTIPRLNLKVPYRFGGGIHFEGKNQAKTVMGEVLIAKKFSVSAGVSWLKVKPMEFFTAKIFREKNRQDFQKSHPKEVPMAFEILNIKVKPTLVQIPLTVAFRNELKNNFSYFVSTGTNVTVKGKESFSFDCRIPNQKSEFLNKSFERKMDIPVINSLNFSAGIEKDWHPIVVQVEGYVYTYFKQLSPESARTGPGVKIKLLYQIGGKMQTK